MTHPIEPEDLVRLAEGTLSCADQARIRSHVDECPGCRSRLADLRAIDRLVGTDQEPSSANGAEHGFSASLDTRLDDVVRRHVGEAAAVKPASRERWTRRGWIGGVVAVAASIVVMVLLRDGSPSAADVRGKVVLASADSVVRGSPASTFHVDLTLRNGGFVAIVYASPKGLKLLFPHQNPVLGTFGLTGPLPKDTSIRIPPSAVADYPASLLSPGGRVLAVTLPQAPTTESMRVIVDEINRGPIRDADGLQRALASRLGPVTVIDSP